MSTSPGKPAHRRTAATIFGLRGRERHFIDYESSVLGGALMRPFGGPEMARADRCVALPHFLTKMDFERVRGAALFAGAVLLSIPGAVPAMSAEYRGTQDQQQACTPDVMRLCGDSVPDVEKIVACLRRNRSGLSLGCGAAFGAGASHRPRHQKG